MTSCAINRYRLFTGFSFTMLYNIITVIGIVSEWLLQIDDSNRPGSCVSLL